MLTGVTWLLKVRLKGTLSFPPRLESPPYVRAAEAGGGRNVVAVLAIEMKKNCITTSSSNTSIDAGDFEVRGRTMVQGAPLYTYPVPFLPETKETHLYHRWFYLVGSQLLRFF